MQIHCSYHPCSKMFLFPSWLFLGSNHENTFSYSRLESSRNIDKFWQTKTLWLWNTFLRGIHSPWKVRTSDHLAQNTNLILQYNYQRTTDVFPFFWMFSKKLYRAFLLYQLLPKIKGKIFGTTYLEQILEFKHISVLQ